MIKKTSFGLIINQPLSMSGGFLGKYSKLIPISKTKKNLVKFGYEACPDNAMIEVSDDVFEWDLDYCKGCGICKSESPYGIVSMETREL